jgi:TPR repeat protein
VKRDLREAFHRMELAAKNGDVPAMLKVGVLHLMGVSGRVDLPRAKEWLYQASQRATRWHSRYCRRWRWRGGRSAFDFNGHSFLNAG